MFKPVVNDEGCLSDKIVTQIKDMIMAGELKPGDKLPSENELSKIFNVSRTSIREAVKILSGLGYLKTKRGMGIFVAEIDVGYLIDQLTPLIIKKESDLMDIIGIRKILETHAASQAAKKATLEDIKKMENAIKSSEVIIQDNRNSVDKKILAAENSRFHMYLAESTGSKVLVRIMYFLMEILLETRQLTIQLPGRIEKSVAGHKDILNAIKNKNPYEAKKAMLSHLNGVEWVISEIAHNKENYRRDNNEA